MAIECEAIVPECKVKFPAVMYGDVNGAKVLAINKDIAIPERGGVLSFTHLVDRYIPCPPGSKFVMKITAEDGREWPRMGRYAMRESEAYWLHLEGTEGWRSLKIKDIDSHEVQTPVGEIADTGGALQPFPAGTITTITFCDGVWTCEIQEPVERKEVPLGEAVKRLVNNDEKLAATIDDGIGEFETTVICKGNDLVMEGDVFISFGRLPDITFYELPTEPAPEPVAEKEPDWLPMTIQGVKVHRNYLGNLGVDEMGFSTEYARQLSEVAARFADEQEFPGESLPMKWTDEDIDVPPSQIDSDGHLELEKEWIRSEYEADRLMRAIRLYKRHLQDQVKD